MTRVNTCRSARRPWCWCPRAAAIPQRSATFQRHHTAPMRLPLIVRTSSMEPSAVRLALCVSASLMAAISAAAPSEMLATVRWVTLPCCRKEVRSRCRVYVLPLRVTADESTNIVVTRYHAYCRSVKLFSVL